MEVDPNVKCLMKDGIVYMGKVNSEGKKEDGRFFVDLYKPFVLAAQQTGPNSVKIRLQDIVGEPEIYTLYNPDGEYRPKSKGLLNEYVRVTTGIELATSMPNNKKPA